MPDLIRVAMGQILIEAGQPQANLKRAVDAITNAAVAGCDLIVLPECLNIGWTDSRAITQAQPIPGAHFELLAQAARQNAIHVAAGLVERSGDKLYNAAVLIDAEGQLRLLHRKIHELDIATHLGTIGLDICADNVPNSLAIGHVLARMGAQIIVSPSAWAVPPDHNQDTHPYGDLWRTSYQQLSKLYDLPIVGVSGVGWLEDGAWNGWKVIGCSLAVDADASIAAEAAYGPEAESLTIVELRLRPPGAVGTALTQELHRRGYQGP
jgi:predicted amidohydrolase